jgi:hypothetical protein
MDQLVENKPDIVRRETVAKTIVSKQAPTMTGTFPSGSSVLMDLSIFLEIQMVRLIENDWNICSKTESWTC